MDTTDVRTDAADVRTDAVDDSSRGLDEAESIITDTRRDNAEIISYYNTWSNRYDEDMVGSGYHLDPYLKELEDVVEISKTSKILDLACGTGLMGKQLKERGYTNVDALDGSQGMLEKAKKKGIYKNCIHALLGPQPIEGVQADTYDLILSVSAIGWNHVHYNCFPSLIDVVKPGGFIYFINDNNWPADERKDFEEKMRKLDKEGKWKCVLMKESTVLFLKTRGAFVYCFKVLK